MHLMLYFYSRPLTSLAFFIVLSYINNLGNLITLWRFKRNFSTIPKSAPLIHLKTLYYIQVFLNILFLGTAGDSLSYHRSQPFATKDNGSESARNCALSFKGAWWYHGCHYSNLNGFYHHGSHSSYADGVNWYAWKGYYYSVKRAEMKIRPVNF